MKKRSIAFIKARWHADNVDQAYAGFCEAMAAKGQAFGIQAYDVPGAFEMPLLAKRLGETGRFDAIVAGPLLLMAESGGMISWRRPSSRG